MNGTIRKGDKVKFFNTGVVYDADEVGCLKMEITPRPEVKRRRCGLHHQRHQDRQRGEGGRHHHPQGPPLQPSPSTASRM
jgi:hypothetical protein